MFLALGLDFRSVGFECRTLGFESCAIGVQRRTLSGQFGAGLLKLAGRGTECSRRLLTGTRLFVTEFCPATRLFVIEFGAEPSQFSPFRGHRLAGGRQLAAFLFEAGVFLTNALLVGRSRRGAEAGVELIFRIICDGRQARLETGAERAHRDLVTVGQRPRGDGSAVDPRRKPGPQVANPQTAGKDREHEMGGGDFGTAELDVATGPAAAERRRAENIFDDAAAIATGDHQASVAAGVGRVGDSREIGFDTALELTDANDVSRSEGGDLDSLAVDPGAAGRARSCTRRPPPSTANTQCTGPTPGPTNSILHGPTAPTSVVGRRMSFVTDGPSATRITRRANGGTSGDEAASLDAESIPVLSAA